MTPPPTFAQRLAALREERGLTPYALARVAGVTTQAVYDLESGDRADPSMSTVRALAFALSVSTDELVGGPERKPEKK